METLTDRMLEVPALPILLRVKVRFMWALGNLVWAVMEIAKGLRKDGISILGWIGGLVLIDEPLPKRAPAKPIGWAMREFREREGLPPVSNWIVKEML